MEALREAASLGMSIAVIGSNLRSIWRGRALAALVMLLVVVLLSWPMIATNSGMSQDWPNHLWLLWQQSLNIERSGLPSLFLTRGTLIFYPFYAFYGGTLYTLGGLGSFVLGNVPVKAYVLSYMTGLVAALGGFYWVARMARVGRWLAHVPGLVFVSSSYLLTDIYARGAWPEFMAVCSIPLLAAAALSILRDDRLHPGPAAALALSTIVLFGSHNITMLWGWTYLALVTATLFVAVPAARSVVSRAGLVRITRVIVPAIMVNAWFLLPTLAYAPRTVAGQGDPALLRSTSMLVDMRRLFTFSRASAVSHIPGQADSPDFALGLPLLPIAWTCLVAAVYALRDRHQTLVRVALIFVMWGLTFGIVMTHAGLIEALPTPYAFVQFQYRLSSYVLLSLSGAMIAILSYLSVHPDTASRIFKIALLPILIVAAAGAAEQLVGYPTIIPDRNVVFSSGTTPPPSAYSVNDYNDVSLPVVSPSPLTLFFPPQAIHHDRIALAYPSSLDGALVRTNLLGAPYLVRVEGARVVGRLANGPMVLRLPAIPAGPRIVTLSRSGRLPIVLGSVISVVGLLGVLVTLLWSAIGELWRRGSVRVRLPGTSRRIARKHD